MALDLTFTGFHDPSRRQVNFTKYRGKNVHISKRERVLRKTFRKHNAVVAWLHSMIIKLQKRQKTGARKRERGRRCLATRTKTSINQRN